MALTATVHPFTIALSDVDRGVYETLTLRVAQHPSETLRHLVLRVLAYALSYEEGIAFSKGGLSSADEAPIAVWDPTGILVAFIDVGSPAAERIHKASKAARRVAIWTTDSLSQLRKEHEAKPIHKADAIAVFRIDVGFVEAIASRVSRGAKVDLTRSDEHLYCVVEGHSLDAPLRRSFLSDALGTR